MSFYGMMFGQNPAAPVLLALLGLTRTAVPRFRDVYIEGDHIVIHTRTGGGNRDYYENEESCRSAYPEWFAEGSKAPTGPWNDDLRKSPFYVSDEDDDYDCTYANFRFRFPEEYAADLAAFRDKVPDVPPSEKWQRFFESMRAPASPAAAEAEENT